MLIASVPSSFLFISSEVLTCEIDVILKTLVEEEELMNLLFSFLEPNRSHSVMLAGYFSKVVICLMLSVGVKNGHDEVNIQISNTFMKRRKKMQTRSPRNDRPTNKPVASDRPSLSSVATQRFIRNESVAT
ncbi:hypothetical protein F2Q70_00035712 [Brassica cretica]|uniref:Uncharacterized protein n=1 Tax=Brassica cretica TaxID=69181 RepID=A0A8S9JY89_BRACR|nr:hypothetical protein F2Q70_00035712 [Brassica cretica]